MDRPDLQSEALDMGVEVVQAITDHDGLTARLVDTYFGRGLPGDKVVELIQQNNTKNYFHGEVGLVDGMAFISSTKGLYDMKKHSDLVTQKLKEKSQKFAQYRQYGVNGLYCFTHTNLMNKRDCERTIDACRESPFQLIFIHCIEEIFIWNQSSDGFITHEIPSEWLYSWKKFALEND